MVDTRSPEQRSRIMRSVGTRNTGPELRVRRLLHAMGLRFRLHRRDLPGRPDVVLPKHRTVIFVHGCFWHSHGCRKGQAPKSRSDYWEPKLQQNKVRDAANLAKLRALGWRAEVVWQCELEDTRRLLERFREMFSRHEKAIDFTATPR